MGLIVFQFYIGSSLYFIRNEKSRLTKKQLFANMITKYVVIPGIIITIMYFFWVLGIFNDNIVMAYMIFMTVVVPMANVVLVSSQIHEIGVSEVLETVLWIYIFAAPAGAIWTFIFFIIF